MAMVARDPYVRLLPKVEALGDGVFQKLLAQPLKHAGVERVDVV